MFERFTDRARKVMALANQAAFRFNHDYIEPEHILCGLIREGSGVGATALRKLDVDLEKMRIEIEELMIRGPDEVTKANLPEGPRAKKVVENTIEEARLLHSDYIGTEHLLLSMVREAEGIVAQVLKNHKLTYEQVRNEVLSLLNKGIDACGEKSDRPRLLRFSDRARKILSLANQEAQRLKHECIDTGHILLGFIKEGSGVGMTVLKELNVDIRKLHNDVEKIMIKGTEEVTTGKLPMSPQAKKVIEYAIEGARSLGQNYVGSEHLLLGMMHEMGGSISVQLLKHHGITYEKVRNEIVKVTGGEKKPAQ